MRPTDHDVRNHRAGGSSTWIGLAIVLAGVLTWLVHGITIGYGFHYDDYHFVHPYSRTDVLAAFHGPWDPAGIETGYFRPLTICLYAARFAAFRARIHALPDPPVWARTFVLRAGRRPVPVQRPRKPVTALRR